MISSVFTKTLHDLRKGLVGWSIGVAATVGLMASIWPSFDDIDYESLMEEYPDALKEAFNITAMGTPAGYLNGELFSIVVPAMFIICAIARGARLIAGEEEDGTLETLVSLPISRTRLLLEKAAALVTDLGALALVLFASTWASSFLVGMDIPVGHIARASLEMFLLGAEFGLIAIALSASTGRRGLTVGLASAAAGAAYLLFLMGQLVEGFEPFLELSPFYQAISAGPIGPGLPGISWAMPVVGLVALAISVPAFERRDLTT